MSGETVCRSWFMTVQRREIDGTEVQPLMPECTYHGHRSRNTVQELVSSLQSRSYEMTLKFLKCTTHTRPICCSQVVCTLKPAQSHASIPATMILRTVVPWLQIQAIHTTGIAAGQLVNLQPLNGQPVSPHNSTSVRTGRIPSPENPTGHVCVPTSSTALVLHVSNQINVQGHVKLLGES